MELHDLGVVEAAAAISRGEITAEALATTLLRRAEALRALNAFVTLDADRVLSAARAADKKRSSGARLGPLHGVPIAIKDNIDTADMPTAAGTPALRAHRPMANAPVVQALIDAGAIVFGKVGMHELAFGVTCNNAAFGPIRNPFDPQRVPGGSSGGSGAAVGARLAPAAIGTDTGGSFAFPPPTAASQALGPRCADGPRPALCRSPQRATPSDRSRARWPIWQRSIRR